MELPRPAVAGIIAVAIILVGAIGYTVLQSNSTTLSDSQEQKLHEEIAQQYRQSTSTGGGPSIYTNPHAQTQPQSTSSGSGGGPSIYK